MYTNILTPEEIQLVGQKFDTLAEELKPLIDKLNSDGGICDTLALLDELAIWDYNKQTDEIVKSCLESVIECIRQAAFDYYVSWK